MLDTLVVGVDEAGLTVQGPSGTERIAAHNMVWAAGVKAAPCGAGLGAPLDRTGRVIVGDDLTLPGHPEVFVVGDLAHRIDPRTEAPVPGVAQGGIQMGRFAGRAIAAEIAARGAGRPSPTRNVFVYKDKGSLATIGKNKAVADIRGLRFGGTLAWLAWALIHVFFLIGFRRRLLAMTEWLWMYVTGGRGVRLITGGVRLPRPLKPPEDRLEETPPTDPTQTAS